MSTIVIRADASLLIGSGHVIRCRTLARELSRRGAEVTFVCRQQPGDLIQLLEREFPVLALPELPEPATELDESFSLNNRGLYASWLGCNQVDDAVDFLQALHLAGIDDASWLVVDHYGLDAVWETKVLDGFSGDQKPKLLVIDDLADRSHQADCLLDQNFFGLATESRYAGLVPKHCRQLLGPHYALLGPEYVQLHQLVPPRTELLRVLVFFGGVDPDNLTGRALEALMDPALAHLRVDVVLGLQSPHRQAVAELVNRRSFTTLHDPLPSLAGLIARADLAIGAGGATTWERSCFGLPSMVVSIADNQLPFAQALHQEGLIEFLGHVDEVTTEGLVAALKTAKESLLSLGHSDRLTDGWGTSRLATVLLGPLRPLSLRRTVAFDEGLLLRWANDPTVRSQSFSSQLISAEDHHRWFSMGLQSCDRLHWILCDASGSPLGQIRFDRDEEDDLTKPHEALISLSMDRCARGWGLAKILVSMGLDDLQCQWGEDLEVVAFVLEGNQASQATFARLGFTREPSSLSKSQEPEKTCWRWVPN